MKTILTVFFVIILYASGITQTAPPISWQRPSGGSGEDNICGAFLCSDGSLLMYGQSGSTDGDVIGNHGVWDGWVVKLDVSGNKLWQKCYGGTNYDGIFDVKETSDHGFIMVGHTASDDGDVTGHISQTDGRILRTDNNGNIIWSKCLGGSGADVFNRVSICNDNGFIVCGRTTSSDAGFGNSKGLTDGWLIKFDASGNVQWQKNYGGSNDEYIMDIMQASDNNFVFCGFSKSSNGDLAGNYGNDDTWFGKVNAENGNLFWSYQYGGSGTDAVYTLCRPADSSGILIASGTTTSPNDYNITGNHGGYDGLLISINETNGILTEAKCFGGNKDDYFWSIKPTFDKGYIISGTAYSKNGDVSYNADINYGQAWVVKLNNSRAIDWEKTYGGPKGEDGYAAFETVEGGYFIAADTYGNGGDVSGYHGTLQRDYWAVRLSPCFQPPLSSATITASGPACGGTVTLSMPGGPAYFYHWYKDNVEIPGAESRIYTATTTGTYNAVVVNALCQLFTYAPKTIESKKQKATITPSGSVTKCAADPITFSANTGSGLTYQWYKGKNPIAGATNSTYTTTQANKYKVLVLNPSTQCSSFSKVTTVTNNCFTNSNPENTAAMNTNAELLFQNIPNPSVNETVIKYAVTLNCNAAYIIITDMVGKTIKQIKITAKGIGTVTVDVSKIAAGAYNYSLYVDGVKMETKKMLIIK